MNVDSSDLNQIWQVINEDMKQKACREKLQKHGYHLTTHSSLTKLVTGAVPLSDPSQLTALLSSLARYCNEQAEERPATSAKIILLRQDIVNPHVAFSQASDEQKTKRYQDTLRLITFVQHDPRLKQANQAFEPKSMDF